MSLEYPWTPIFVGTSGRVQTQLPCQTTFRPLSAVFFFAFNHMKCSPYGSGIQYGILHASGRRDMRPYLPSRIRARREVVWVGRRRRTLSSPLRCWCPRHSCAGFGHGASDCSFPSPGAFSSCDSWSYVGILNNSGVQNICLLGNLSPVSSDSTVDIGLV